MLNSTNWVGYISAIMLIAVSFAAVLLEPKARPQKPVDANFIGSRTFGLWSVVCENMKPRTAPGSPEAPERRVCRTNAQKRVQSGDQILLAAGFNVLFVGPEREPGILLRLPPSAIAGDHINFAIDKNTMFQAPMGRCSPKECIVQGMLPVEALAQMKVGKVLTLMYTANIDQKDREIRVEQTLQGFPESFEALTKATGG